MSDIKYILSVRDYVPQFLNLKAIGDSKFFLNALYTAVDEQVDNLLTISEGASKQLFISTASGRYLINLGNQEGFSAPTDAGLDSDSFRQIVPAVVSSPKQVMDTIVKIMSIFYDKTRINPYIISTMAEPYSFLNGDNIIISTDTGDLNIAILSTAVSDINNVAAAEIAGIINSSQSKVQADVYVAKDTGLSYLRLVSSAYGTGAFIQITGGTAQNIIQFPDVPDTNQVAGMGWDLFKDQSWTDVLKFRWNGTGSSPNLYNLEIGDFVSIREMSGAYEVLNGTFQIIDVGYENVSLQDRDYFIVRNFQYQNTTGSITQPNDNSIFFTKNKKRRIFDAAEYAVVSETGPRSISVFVPAVPQVLRKTLRASGHAHGSVADVIDFERGFIQITTTRLDAVPTPANSFFLINGHMRPDASLPYYKTVSRVNLPDPVFNISSDPEFSIMPYTVPTVISSDLSKGIQASVFSRNVEITFDYPHGLRPHWGFTVSNATGAANFTSGILNQELQVIKVLDNYRVLATPDNSQVKFTGIPFSGFQLFQNNTFEDGYDFFLTFASPAAIVSAGLEIGMSFTLDYTGSTINPTFDGLALQLSLLKFQVISISGNNVNCYVGLGFSTTINTIATAGAGLRSGNVGGVGAEYFFDKTSDYNKYQVMDLLSACFIEFTESSNPRFVGPYVYDPTGVQTTVTVGSPVTTVSQEIFKGSNLTNIIVDSVSDFPQSGYVFLEYGTDRAEGPVRYFSVISGDGLNPSQIILDPAYVFKFNHDTNCQIQNVVSLEKFTPQDDGYDYPLYITGVVQARNFFFSLLRQIVAAGIFISEEIDYPDLRYRDPSLQPFD